MKKKLVTIKHPDVKLTYIMLIDSLWSIIATIIEKMSFLDDRQKRATKSH